jgi:hypothetical protein
MIILMKQKFFNCCDFQENLRAHTKCIIPLGNTVLTKICLVNDSEIESKSIDIPIFDNVRLCKNSNYLLNFLILIEFENEILDSNILYELKFCNTNNVVSDDVICFSLSDYTYLTDKYHVYTSTNLTLTTTDMYSYEKLNLQRNCNFKIDDKSIVEKIHITLTKI